MRYYHPETGRWTGRDPAANCIRILSDYDCVGNDPIRRVDILGAYYNEDPIEKESVTSLFMCREYAEEQAMLEADQYSESWGEDCECSAYSISHNGYPEPAGIGYMCTHDGKPKKSSKEGHCIFTVTERAAHYTSYTRHVCNYMIKCTCTADCGDATDLPPVGHSFVNNEGLEFGPTSTRITIVEWPCNQDPCDYFEIEDTKLSPE